MNPLKLARAKKDWTLQELSDRSGVPRDTISKIETDKRKASFRTLFKLATALEIDIETLLPLEAKAAPRKPKTENFRRAA